MNKKNLYETSNMYLAAFLLARGHKYTLTRIKAHQTVFQFTSTNKLEEDIPQYFNEYINFTMAIKQIKEVLNSVHWK